MYTLFSQGLILVQSLDVTDITGLMSAKELTVNGLLLIGIIMLWRRMSSAEEKAETNRVAFEAKLEVLRAEKEADYKKYVELLLITTKTIDENTKMYARLEKLLDK